MGTCMRVCIMAPNRPKGHGSLREDHEPAWIYLSIGGCPPNKMGVS